MIAVNASENCALCYVWMQKLVQRDKEKSYYRLPSIIFVQGSKLIILARKVKLWLARIKRDGIKKDRFGTICVCSDHFVSGAPLKLNNPNWAPSLKLGYKRSQSTSGDITHTKVLGLFSEILEESPSGR